MIDFDGVQRWLDAYVHAWQTNDPARIGSLFTDEAEYRWHPWDTGDEVARGRDEIVAAWLEDTDPPGSYQASYRPLLVQGDVAITVGTTRYYADATLDEEFHNLFQLRFADDGRCSSFVEWYMKTPAAAASKA